MGLSSALFTGLSGLDVNQTRLSVVGNNIANANTIAFKSSRALAKPQFYVSGSSGTAPTETTGGSNPSQYGLGALIAAVDKDFTPGSIEATGKATDLAIDGDGFFVARGSEEQFTRDGAFSLNANNQLITTDGALVQGYAADSDGNIITGTLQDITIPVGTTTTAQATRNVKMEGNLDASGDVAAGASILTSQLITTVGGAAAPTGTTLLTDLASQTVPTAPLITAGQTFTLAGTRGGRDQPERSFTVTSASTVQDLLSFYQQGLGIETTVPDDGNAATPTAGATLETDATTTTAARLVVTGNLGKENALELGAASFVDAAGATPFSFNDGVNAAGIASDASGESVHTSIVGYDSLGTPITVDVTAVLESKSTDGNTWRFFATSGNDTDPGTALGTGTLTFDSEGQLKASSGTNLSIDRTNTGAKTPLSIDVDFSSLTSLTSDTSELVMTEQDGFQIGTLNSYSFGTDGKIVGSFSNGLTRTLGQVAVATFANNQGLVDRGGNMFVTGPDSGVPVIAGPQQLGAGAIRAGALEQSNVDLSKEFVNMIISSTGFSAASKVITTSDQLIQELLNSTR